MDHQHTADIDWAERIEDLDRSASVEADRNRAIVAWLTPAVGARVADVGCGTGAMTALLAEAVGGTGQVVALDGEATLLAATAARCASAGVAGRVSTVRHDLTAGPLPAADLDLVWAAGVVHHLPDQQAAVDMLTRTLAPGGRLALAEGGLSSRSLPWDLGVGRPGLEERLAAAEAEWFAAMRADMDHARSTPYGWSAVLRAAGLGDVSARSFLLDRPAPLQPAELTHVLAALAVRVAHVSDWLCEDDRAAWRRLLDPDDEQHLGRRADLFVLSARTVHVGSVVQPRPASQ